MPCCKTLPRPCCTKKCKQVRRPKSDRKDSQHRQGSRPRSNHEICESLIPCHQVNSTPSPVHLPSPLPTKNPSNSLTPSPLPLTPSRLQFSQLVLTIRPSGFGLALRIRPVPASPRMTCMSIFPPHTLRSTCVIGLLLSDQTLLYALSPGYSMRAERSVHWVGVGGNRVRMRRVRACGARSLVEALNTGKESEIWRWVRGGGGLRRRRGRIG